MVFATEKDETKTAMSVLRSRSRPTPETFGRAFRSSHTKSNWQTKKQQTDTQRKAPQADVHGGELLQRQHSPASRPPHEHAPVTPLARKNATTSATLSVRRLTVRRCGGIDLWGSPGPRSSLTTGITRLSDLCAPSARLPGTRSRLLGPR